LLVYSLFHFELYFGVFLFLIDVTEAQNSIHPYTLLWTLSIFIPTIGIAINRYFIPTYAEEMFFGELNKLAPKFGEELYKFHYPPWYEYLKFYFWRVARLIKLGIAIWIFSLLPYIGRFAIPFAAFYKSYRFLGIETAVILGLIGLYPPFTPYLNLFLKIWIASTYLARELMDPYLARIDVREREIKKQEKKNPSFWEKFCKFFTNIFKLEKHREHDEHQQEQEHDKVDKSDDKTKRRKPMSPATYFRTRYFGWMLGFALPWTLVLWIPVIGLPLFGIAQASAPTVILQVLKKK